MATASERHPGGRPRVRPASPLLERIEGMARRRGLRLDELAERAGLGVATLYQLNDPRVSTAKALADALGVTVDRLIREEPASKRTARQRSA